VTDVSASDLEALAFRAVLGADLGELGEALGVRARRRRWRCRLAPARWSE